MPDRATAVLSAEAEAAEVELAEVYRLLGAAVEAQGRKAEAEQWYAKSAALKRFRRQAADPLPLPADTPVQKLP